MQRVTSLGYSVVTTSELDMMVPGTYVLDYQLYYNGTAITGAEATRTIIIKGPNYSVDGRYFATLAEAYVEAIRVNKSIVVEQNNTDNSAFVVEAGKTVVLEMNGKTITKITNTIINRGNLTISGEGTIQSAVANENVRHRLVENEGNLTLLMEQLLH